MRYPATWALVAALTAAGTAAAEPMATDLGTLDGSTIVVDGTLEPNGLVWFTFNAPNDIVAPFFVDITTNGTEFDTEIGLYDALGNRVADDDDDGFGVDSTLSFGAGSGQMLGDGFNLGGDGLAQGEDGDFVAGRYFLVLGEFNVNFGATDFDVESTGFDDGGSYTIAIVNNAVVPEPASLAMAGLGLGVLGAALRRRLSRQRD